MQAMRYNLVTPFADKDRVKALGARWDPARKVWYVTDPPDLTPFLPWIPDLSSAQQQAGSATKPSKGTSRAAAPAPSGPRVAHCGCAVLPWEPCPHSPATRA